MKITWLDSVECKADKEAIAVIKEVLKYPSTYWKKSAFGKKRIERDAFFIDGRSGLFLSGLLPRVKKVFKSEIDLKYKEHLEQECKPNLKKIRFRNYQVDLIEKAIKLQRGMIKAPTGVGKTVVAMGLLSCFPSATSVFLCHNISILKQTAADFEKNGLEFNFVNPVNKNIKKGINLSSIQTLANIPSDEYDVLIDVLIVDECHRVSKTDSQYGKVISSALAPVKIGLSATPTDFREKKKILAQEGLLGPIIGEYTMEEGVKQKIFVEPEVKLIPIPYQDSIGNLFKFDEIYNSGIVNNKIRNRLIIQETIRLIKKGETSLILIKDLDHGENLLDIVYEEYGEYWDDFIFVKGNTHQDERERVRLALDKGEIKAAIASVVFTEGINIPSLKAIVIGAGMKSMIRILQSVGRGTRKSKNKDKVIVVDFVDPYKYLAQHFTERLSIYLEKGWKISGRKKKEK